MKNGDSIFSDGLVSDVNDSAVRPIFLFFNFVRFLCHQLIDDYLLYLALYVNTLVVEISLNFAADRPR